MNNLDRIKHLRAQDYGVAGLSTTDVDWLIAEVERLTAERDRYKAWHDEVMAQRTQAYIVERAMCSPTIEQVPPSALQCLSRTRLIVRPQPLKENE